MRYEVEQDLLDALTAAIVRSPIVVKRRARVLPAGFEDVDVAVLEWIVTEARRARHGLRLM